MNTEMDNSDLKGILPKILNVHTKTEATAKTAGQQEMHQGVTIKVNICGPICMEP